MIFLNRFFYPDHSATSQILSDLAFALAEHDHSIRVITSRQQYDDPKVRLAARGKIGKVEIHRVWSSQFGRSNLLGRAIDYLTFYIAAAWTLWRIARPYEVIVAKTDPPMLSIVIVPVVRLRRARLVNWLQDVFPEVASNLGMGKSALVRGTLAGLMRLRDRSLRRSTMTVAIGERMSEHITRIGVPEDQVRVIANWADGALIRPVPPRANSLRKEWELADAFVVGYSGNLGRAHDYGAVLEAIAHIERIANDDPDRCPRSIVWLFIGGGSQYDALRRESVARSLSSLRFRPYQPRERLAESLSAPDVHLVSLRPALEGLIVPSKFYGIAAAGRPTLFIGASDGEIGQLLDRHGCGVTLSEGDGAGLARTVLDLAARPDHVAQMGARARAMFERDYDKPVAIAKWKALLEEIGIGEAEKRSPPRN